MVAKLAIWLVTRPTSTARTGAGIARRVSTYWSVDNEARSCAARPVAWVVVANDGEAELSCVSIQSPPVAAAELYSDQLAEVAGYDDDDDL